MLYIIDSTILDLQLENLKEEREKLIKEIASLKLLEQSYLAGKNLIDKDNMEYYNRYLVYKYNYEQLALDLNQAEKRYRRE